MPPISDLYHIIQTLQKCGLKGLTEDQITLLLYSLRFDPKAVNCDLVQRTKWYDVLTSPDEASKLELKNQSMLVIKFVSELIQKLLQERIITKPILESSKALHNYLRLKVGSLKQEVMVVLFLDSKSQLIEKIVFQGTHNRMVVSPKEIFRQAVLYPIDKVVIAHNHPSGRVEPSKEDIKITRNLVKAGQILGIQVTDHIIVSANTTLSLSDNYPDLFH